jgi:hypothetical protein
VLLQSVSSLKCMCNMDAWNAIIPGHVTSWQGERAL